MKKKMTTFKYFIMTIAFLLLVLTGTKTTSVQANTNSTLSNAISINIGDSVNDTFVDNNEVFYYKFTIPKNIGDKYINITLNNDGKWILEFSVCEKTGEWIEKGTVHPNNACSIKTCTNSSISSDLSTLTQGETYYIKVYKWSAWAKGDFTLSITSTSATQKQTISKLSLTKYKKGSKKIVGKTIKNATVKITVNKKSYTVQSNKKGKFSVKLKKKLKSKQKIKISVSRKNYKTKKKTFKVK